MTTLNPPRPIHSPATDRERAIATLVTAFSADPVIRWLFPDASTHLSAFPQLLELAGGTAFPGGTADAVDDHAGIALWVAPGVEPDNEALAALLERSLDPGRLGEAFAFLEQVGEHHPDVPCWYLPFVGVDPRSQGQGLGSQLLARGLQRSDADGLPAYLEASSPRNRALYERHGFEVIAEIRGSEDAPPLWPMLRPAQ